jgi:hypothetical protein
MTDEIKHQIVRERLRDYRKITDYQRDLAELVAAWKKHHPLAALEETGLYHPLDLVEKRGPDAAPDDPDELWRNDLYDVTLRRREDKVFGTSTGMIQLGISAHDGTARHDWREFQEIKNQLAGPECEAFELYPAESRLLDPSNYYTLWCFPGLRHIKLGKFEGRRVWDQDEAIAPQRKLP